MVNYWREKESWNVVKQKIKYLKTKHSERGEKKTFKNKMSEK